MDGRPRDFSLVARLFDEAIDVSGPERDGVLAGVDVATRAEVVRLLELAVEAQAALEGVRWRLSGDVEEGEILGLPEGTRIGAYTVLSLIGRGGTSLVYRARQDEPAREIAVKVPLGVFASEAQARRFGREARTLGLLQHPGIAQVISAGTFASGGAMIPYFAMELVQGEPITAFAARLPIPERLELAASVCDAVEHAHQRGVIHRDLKPSNILVEPGGRIRVLDFGVATLIDPTGEAMMTVDRGALVGTLAYMSPEQLACGIVDTRSDLYALGIVAYEMLTGERPFATPGDLLEAVRERRETSAPRPSSRVRALRGDVEAVLLKALEPDPGDRYQSAGAMAADLRAAARRSPVSARPPGFLRSARCFVHQHRVLAAASAAAGATLLAGAGATAWQAVRASEAEARAMRRSEVLGELSHALLEFSSSTRISPGSIETRDAILNKVLPMLDRLAVENPADVALQRDVAGAYAAMARHLGFPRNPNLGRGEEAAAAYRTALGIIKRVGSDDTRWVIQMTSELGETLSYQGDAAGADECLAAVVEAYRALAAASPGDLELLYQIADAGQRRVISLGHAGRADEAAALARELPSMIPGLDRAHATDAAGAFHLSNAHQCVGIAFRWGGDLASAAERLRLSLELARQARTEEPSNPVYTAGVGNSARHLGLTLSDLGRWDDAGAALAEATEAFRDSALARAGRNDSADILATTLLDLAHARSSAGRHTDALAAMEDGIARHVALLAADRSNAYAIRHACLSHWTATTVCLAAAREEGAAASEQARRAARASELCATAIALARSLATVNRAESEYLVRKLTDLAHEVDSLGHSVEP